MTQMVHFHVPTWHQQEMADFVLLTSKRPQSGAIVADELMQRLPEVKDPTVAAFMRGAVFSIRRTLQVIYGAGHGCSGGLEVV